MSDSRSRPEDQKEALLEAARAAVTDAQARRGARRDRDGSNAGRVVLLGLGSVLFVLSIYLLVARPAWFFTPPPPPETPRIQEASLRLMLVREAQHIRAFAQERGSLPPSLGEIGPMVTGLEYVPNADGTFVLRTPFGGDTLELASTDSVGPFLGNSFRIVSRRNQP